MNVLETDRIIPATPRRSRRGVLALGAAAVCVAAVTTGLTLVGHDDGTAPQIVEMPVEESPPPPAVVVPRTLSDTTRLELDGIGPIRVGMTLDEASAAHGKPVAITPGSANGPGFKRGCFHAEAEGGPDGLAFMVVNGRIVRVEAGRGPVVTPEGIGSGSPVQDVLAAYAGRIRVEPHTYSARFGGQYLIVDNTSGGNPMSLLFETDGKQVTMFRSGLTGAVMAPEGCI